MITTTGALFIASNAIEAVIALLIAIKTFRQPKKVRYILLVFSLLTLPASIVNTLCYINKVPSHWNSFAYLFSTLFMLALHFWLNLDVGRHLRVGGIEWKNPLVLIGAAGLGGSMACLTTELIILLIRNDPYPIRGAFITGVCLAILCDSATYTYSFSSLILLKKRRIHEGQSRTTSLGVWFLFIQSLWYIVFGILYVWFFCQTWEDFTDLLVFDYILRFILCLMFTWSPPNSLIRFMTGKLFSDLSHREGDDDTRGNDNKFDNNKEQDIQISAFSTIPYEHKHADIYTQKTRPEDLEAGRDDVSYASHVAIVN